MSDLPAFPDMEVAFVALLGDLGLCLTATDEAFDAQVAAGPVHRITVYGGSDDGITDKSRVDVDTFATTKTAARDAAEAVRQRLIGKPHVLTAAGVVVDRVVTDTKPRQVPYAAGSDVVRYTAAYAASARRS